MSIFVGDKVTFDAIHMTRAGVKVIEEDVEGTVGARSHGPVVAFEGRYYELFSLPGERFVDVSRPLGKC